MTPEHDAVLAELHRLRDEVADMRRRQGGTPAKRMGHRIQAASAFLAGVLAAALSAFVPTLGAQGTSIAGCVAAGTNYLRIAGVCAPGEKAISILSADLSKDSKTAPPAKPGTGMRVTAPFEVVDEKGVVIMRVTGKPQAGGDDARGVKVYGDDGELVALVVNVQDGGLMKVLRDGSDDETVSMAAWGNEPALTIKEGRVQRVTVGPGAKANFALRVFNESAQLVAAAGQSLEGAGLFAAYDTSGKQRVVVNGLIGSVSVKNNQDVYIASMRTSDDGKGLVNVYNDNGVAVGALTQGASGGGLLQLGDATGSLRVEAGTTASGVGLVRTGPMALPMLPGIPGSFILGKR